MRAFEHRVGVAWAAVALLGCASQRPGRRAWPTYPLRGTERSAFEAALATVIDTLPADSAATCVWIRGPGPAYSYVPDRAMRRRLGTRRDVRAGDRCPPTYESMVVTVDSAGRPLASRRPRGYVDPHDLDVAEQAYWLPDSARVIVHAMQGTRGRTYHCVSRPVGSRWVARCRVVRTFISAAPPNEALQQTTGLWYASLRSAPGRSRRS